MDQLERNSGALLGLAVGDAAGTTLEFRPPGSFSPIEDMLGVDHSDSRKANGLTIRRWCFAWRRA